MKKIAKISLVAAVAVAGLTTANAQPLEEAIKNVDVSGSVVYRYNDVNDQGTTRSTNSIDKVNNNYKVGLNLSSKVNDDVKFNSRLLVSSGDAGNFATLDTTTAADQSSAAATGVTLSNANFAYTGVKNTTVTVGKQGLATPFTVASQIDDNEQTGTGALVLSAIGPVTLGAGYFNQTNLNVGSTLEADADVTSALNSHARAGNVGNVGNVGNEDIYVLAAIAAVGPVTLDAWYADLSDEFKTYTLGAKSDFTLGGVALGATARYANLNLDWADSKNDIIKVGLTAKAGIFSGSADYAKTNKDGGITALDSDAATALKGWYVNSLNKANADYYKLMAGVDILSNLNLSANYGDIKFDTDTEDEEIYGQLTYKMSKNLSTYVRYGTYTRDVASQQTIDATAGRLQVAYTF